MVHEMGESFEESASRSLEDAGDGLVAFLKESVRKDIKGKDQTAKIQGSKFPVEYRRYIIKEKKIFGGKILFAMGFPWYVKSKDLVIEIFVYDSALLETVNSYFKRYGSKIRADFRARMTYGRAPSMRGKVIFLIKKIF